MSADPQEEAQVQVEVEAALALVTSSTTDAQVIHFLRRVYTLESRENTIHPLFAWERWRRVSKQQYLSMLPALALASHMLNEPLTTNFINALIYCPANLKLDSFHKPRKSFQWLTPQPNSPLGPAAQRRYEDALDKLVPHIKWIPRDWTPHLCAVTDPRSPIHDHAPGVRSAIGVSLARITAVIPSSNTHKSLASLLLCYLELAHIFLHELMHAIAFAQDGARYGERFFCENPYVENGFSWEEVALGGILELERKNSRVATLLLRDLDLRNLVQCHNARNLSFPVTGTDRLIGEVVREVQAVEVMGKFQDLLGGF